MPENLEVKIKVSNLARLQAVAKSLGKCIFDGIQRDTYFQIPGARLKLREMGGAAELIFYTRPNVRGTRWSRYSKARVANPRAVRQMLSKLLGVKAVVRKHRSVFLYRTGRIHLDRVNGLGTFLEIEVPKMGNATDAKNLVHSILEKMQLKRRTVIGRSYSDLVRRS